MGKKWNNEIRNLNGLDTAEEGIDELEDGIEEITQNAVLERQWSGKWELKDIEIKKIQHMANWNSSRKKENGVQSIFKDIMN